MLSVEQEIRDIKAELERIKRDHQGFRLSTCQLTW